jgi:hypothetical protein
LILNPGDEICSREGSVESKNVKRNTQKLCSENVLAATCTFQLYDTVDVISRPPST